MIRVLHVVENFNGQAVESWLTRLIQFDGFDSSLLHFDFFLLGIGLGRHVEAVLQKGCKLHESNPGGASIPQMARTLRRVVIQGGYQIVHIHQDVMAGVFAVALLGTGVRVITHIHNCWQRLPVGGVSKEKWLTEIARRLALWRSSALVGVSKQAISIMTRGGQSEGRADRVIYCSPKVVDRFDLSDPKIVLSSIRTLYDLPSTARILLFLGRLDNYKNPMFALKVLKRMIEEGNEDVYLLVAGVGGMAHELEETASKDGIADHLRCLGWVEDPSPLLLAAGLLLMPSAECCGEGLGLSAVEAQGYGLPVLASLSIPEDAAIVPGLFERRSLSEGAIGWAQAAKKLLARGRADHLDSMKYLAASAFTDSASYSALADLYVEVTASPLFW